MPTPLAEVLTQLRVGNQSFVLDFYQRTRYLFSRWAQRQHGLAPAPAHALLRATLLDFYDQVLDGRLTRLPADLRAHLYGMAQERLQAQVPTEQPLPAAEAARRQHLLGQLLLMDAQARRVLTYSYFKGYSLEQTALKLGLANAGLARRLKADHLRRLYEMARSTAPQGPFLRVDLRPYLDTFDRYANGLLSAAEDEALGQRLADEPDLGDAHMAYEQFSADLRWAVGHDSLRHRLRSLDERLNQRGTALVRIKNVVLRRQQRTLLRGAAAAALALALAGGLWWWARPASHPATVWQAYYQPDAGPALSPGQAHARPLLAETLRQYRNGHYAAAQHLLGRLSPAAVGPDTLLYLRGLLLLRLNQPAAAQNPLRRLADGPGPLAARARYHLGMAHWQLAEPTAARRRLQQVAADAANPYQAVAQQALLEL